MAWSDAPWRELESEHPGLLAYKYSACTYVRHCFVPRNGHKAILPRARSSIGLAAERDWARSSDAELLNIGSRGNIDFPGRKVVGNGSQAAVIWSIE